MKSYEFLFWAYNVFWAGIAAYLVFLSIRLRRVRQRLDGIDRRLGGREDG